MIKDWIEECSEYEAIVDGANVGLYQQNFAEGGFSIPQVVFDNFCHLNHLWFCMPDIPSLIFVLSMKFQ